LSRAGSSLFISSRKQVRIRVAMTLRVPVNLRSVTEIHFGLAPHQIFQSRSNTCFGGCNAVV
jgi:hypothetical protein